MCSGGTLDHYLNLYALSNCLYRLTSIIRDCPVNFFFFTKRQNVFNIKYRTESYCFFSYRNIRDILVYIYIYIGCYLHTFVRIRK